MSPDSRYDRQARLPQIGAAGQAALGRASAAVVGLGASGSLAADLLARAGVGRLILVDRDVVEATNLQRQLLYSEADAAAAVPKAEAAGRRLRAVNSAITVETHAADLAAGNAPALLAGADLLVDGTDNFATRYLLNDWSVREGVPFVYAGVVGTYGLVGALLPGEACLRCSFPEPPRPEESPTCRSAGVLGPAVAVVAGHAAAEAIKILSGHPEACSPGLRYFDLWTGQLSSVRTSRDPACPACARREFAWLEGSRGNRLAEPLCGGNSVQVPATGPPPDLPGIARRLGEAVQGLELRPAYLRFRDGELDLLLFADGRALVRGTEDPGRARAVLARTVGA